MAAAGMLRVEPDPVAVAQAAAAIFVGSARSSIAARGKFSVALSGGSTPRALYRLLAAPPYREQVNWPELEVYFGDERCVPPTHADSNYRMAREALLDRVPLRPERVHRIHGELPPQEAALEYEQVLGRRLTRERGWPRLDLVLLGMGPDGHTASLFPGTPAVAERQALAVAVYVPHLASYRVTLTVPVLSAAAEILMLVVGAEKTAALAQVFAGDEQLPAALIRPMAGAMMTWLVDREAAAKLPQQR